MKLPFKTVFGHYKKGYFYTDYGGNFFIGSNYDYLDQAFLVLDFHNKILTIIPVGKKS